jgi:hypothetical protein
VKRRTNIALTALVAVGLSIPVVRYWQGQTLTQLQQCYREIPTSGRQYFESPCASMRLRLESARRQDWGKVPEETRHL